jgi:hypothetical protein
LGGLGFGDWLLGLCVARIGRRVRDIFRWKFAEFLSAGEGLRPIPTPESHHKKRHGIPEFVRALKSFSSRRINQLRGKASPSIWQRTYWDNIIRNETMLKELRHYTLNNPAQWAADRYYSES